MLLNVLEIAKGCVGLVGRFAAKLSLLEDRMSAASSKLSTSTSVTVQDRLRDKLQNGGKNTVIASHVRVYHLIN